MIRKEIKRYILFGIASLVFLPSVICQLYLPNEVNTTVNGYQDDFEGYSLKSGWLISGLNVYSVNNGVLKVSSATGDPNHLIYNGATYNNSNQEVLLRVRIINFGTGDPPRGGAAVCVDPGANPIGGIGYHFRDNSGRGLAFLDDKRAWGPSQSFSWQNNVWYWMRLKQEPNAASEGGSYDVFGKIWLADGSEPEPSFWQLKWDYIPTRTARTGHAGVVAGSSGGISEFEVDYILIKASGLPQITVTPQSFVQIPVSIKTQPQDISVVELMTATFTAGVSGSPPPVLQWYRNNQPISGATNATYTIQSVKMSDTNSLFYLVAANIVSNTTYSVTSRVARLTVSADEQPPHLVSARSIAFNEVEVKFSELISQQSATNLNNYRITNSAQVNQSILSTALLDDGKSVLLKVNYLSSGGNYTIYATGISDCSSRSNTMQGWETTTFTAPSYTTTNINNGLPVGTLSISGNKITISGGGGNIGGTADQFNFIYRQIDNDFDVRVRVESFQASDIWAKAGIMARETLDSGSKFASTLATPALNGVFMSYRATSNSQSVVTGSYPLNYPFTYLRLKRTGNDFYSFASMDGETWSSLGKTNISMVSRVYIGFAVSSAIQGSSASVIFQDFSTTINSQLIFLPRNIEPLGQTTRRTPLVISEVMYNPYSPDALNYEFIELFNSSGTPIDISSYRLEGDIKYSFATNTVIAAGGFLVIARKPEDIISHYGITNVLGPYDGSLPNNGGKIKVFSQSGAVLLDFSYETKPPWPIAADGTGHSMVLVRPSLGLNNPLAWGWSDKVDGSPGRAEGFSPSPLRNVVINEFLAASQSPDVDFVELYNHSDEPVDISGCYLADNRNPLSEDSENFRIANGTVIPPRGFVVFTQNQIGLALNSGGESIILWNQDADMVIDGVKYEAQDRGVSTGRYPDGSSEFYPLITPTLGSANSQIRVSDVVINEIMYAPISRDDNDEYVELFNRSTNVVDISGWRFVDGIDYTFPTNTLIKPGQYIVVAKNLTNLLSKYSQLNSTNIFGNFSGSLANGGERIALAKWSDVVRSNLLVAPLYSSLTTPQQRGFIIPTNSDYLIGTNRNYIIVDEVTYNTGGEWGEWSKYGGSSLELIDFHSNKRLPSNWADSDETQKVEWTDFTVTGYVDNGITSSADQLQVLLQGAGECLIDNIEVLNSLGQNVIANSTFESGISGWVAEGTEETSSLETAEGFQSSNSYHLRAIDRGDNQINRIRISLSSPLTANSKATIRGKVRWLKGHPEILFRIRGCWLEAAVKMNIPRNPGTPGLPNSHLTTNAPPAIYEIAHTPVVPLSGENVVVTARVHDPDDVSCINLYYRIDPSTNYMVVPMVDDGTGGDKIAGDGIFSAIIPGQQTGILVAFYISASDLVNPLNFSIYPKDAPNRECLVLFGDSTPTGNFPVYRLWMTQSVFYKWSYRHKLNNAPLPITFVVGTSRAIYGASGLFAGSPYIAPGFNTPSGNRCGYSILFPDDDEFLGDTDLVLDWPGGHGGETTAIQEQMAYWIADKINLPNSYRYFIRLNVNGVKDMQRGGVFEAVLQPGGQYIEQWSADISDGDFYKVDRAFEFNDSGSLIADPMPRLENYTSADGSKKTARYRWNWLKRSYDTANNYTNIFNLVDAANATSPEPYTTKMNQISDMEQWMHIFAFEHIINNFDSWGHTIGKNMYAFKPDRGKWVLYPFDLDWLMLVSTNGPGNYTATTGPLFAADDPLVVKMYNHPPFRRAYFRAVLDAVNSPLKNSIADAVMDAKYKSLQANGITMCDGATLTDPSVLKTWFNDRRNFLLASLASNSCNFAVSSPTNNFTTNNNLLKIEGVAPIEVSAIYVNGTAVNLTWSTVSNWFAYYPLNNLSNNIVISAYDYKGHYITGSSNIVNVYLSTMPEEPKVVITEIMYNPVNQGAAFLELFNPSTNCAINLSDWRITGIGYKFSQGSILLPQNYIVLAKDITVFAATYGTNINVFDQFDGSLDNRGETITILKPTNQGEFVVDKVRYESVRPWPQNTVNGGASLQLIDITKDNARVINWSDGNDWRFFYYTGTLTPTNKRLFLYPNVAGDIYIDDIKLVSGTVPEIGENLIRGGEFEDTFLTSQGGFWGITGSAPTQTAISTNVSHTGTGSLHIVFSSFGGSSQNIYQDILVSESGTYTLSFWYLPSTNVNKLIAYFSSLFRPEVNVRSISFYTPGTSNSVAAPMPEFPPIWLNEVQPENVSGPTDNFGERDPWIEIYNSGTNFMDVSGWYLTDDYNNLTKWAFPDGTVIQPLSFLVVWADNQPEQTSGTNIHANFMFSPTNGSVALVMGSNHKVYDYLNYNNLLAGYSYGYRDDDEIFYCQKFRISTPGALNATEDETLTIAINELMAANDGLVIDCINGGSPDWLELYNYETNSYDLSGFFFTDDLDDKFKFEIPDGYVIQPKGFLVAWADNSPSKNNLSRDPSLHLNFALGKSGGIVALFSPQGNLINSYTYDAMDENEIFGRFPDGTGSIFKLIQPTPGSTNARPMIQTNYPPIIIVDHDYYVMPGNKLQFTVQVVDYDIPQQFFTFSLSNAPSGATIGGESGLFVWQVPSNYPISTNMITIIVEDDGVPPQKSQSLIRVIVTTGNHPPVIQPVDDQLVNEGITLFVMVQASDTDTPSQQLTYTLDQAPQGAYINQQTGVFQWTPTELQGPGDYTITVRVTDNGVPQMYSTVTFRIHVNEVNSAPMLLPIETQYLIVGQQLNLQVVGTDSDVPIQNLRYSIESGSPAGMTIDSVSGQLNWTATESAIGTNTVSVKVSDDGSPVMSAVRSFQVVVGAKPRIEISRAGSSGELIKLSFDSLPNKKYQIEYVDSLGSNWLTNIVLTGTGEKLNITNSANNPKQRFFRLSVQ